MKFKVEHLSILGALSLVACGGGGGGSTPAAVTPTATLTSANKNAVSQDTVSSSLLPISSVQTLTGARTINESAPVNFALAQIYMLPNYIATGKAASVMVGAVQTQTRYCPVSGSLSLTVNDADNNGLASAGDSVTIAANACNDGTGTVNGSINFAFNAASGDLNSNFFHGDLTMTLSSLTVSSGQFNSSANGSINVTLSSSGANTLATTVSTPSLSVSASYAGQTRSMSLTNYSGSTSRSPNATYGYVTSYSVNGSLTSSSISSQTISFATNSPFVTYPVNSYPSSGVLVITGAANSKIKLTAISSSQVNEELDANGDGIYEESSIVAWNSLM
jgi:hypothetical protein